MQLDALGPLFDTQNGSVPFCYLLEWEWPEHIEMLIRRAIWSHLASTDASEVEHLEMEDKDALAIRIAWLIAVNPATNAAILDALSFSECRPILVRLAENPSTSEDTLNRLATNESSDVRRAVAENPNISEEVLSTLAADESIDVRYVIAESILTPEFILETLTEDENCYVAHRAQQTLIKLHPMEVLTMPIQSHFNQSQSERRRAIG